MRKLLFAQGIVLAALALWFHLGLAFFYFAHMWWYDIPAHILGGMWAGFFCMWAALHFRRHLSLTYVIVGVFLIGVMWEVFEVMLGIGGSPFMSYPLDTAKDLLDDVVGAFIAGTIASLL